MSNTAAGPIVVGTDGSAGSARAVDWAGRLALDLDRDVVLVHAVGLIEHLPGADPVIANDVRDRVDELLHTAWAQPLVDLGCRYRCFLDDGPARLVLTRVAQASDAALVVVGSHGAGRAQSLLLGATSHGVAQLARTPVVIVPDLDRRQ